MTTARQKKALDIIISATGFRPGRDRLRRLRGDASTRTYYRLKQGRAAPVIVALYPEPFDPRRFDYLDVGRLLAGSGFQVPAVLDMHPGEGVLILEDLGDMTGQRFLAHASRDERVRFYRRAVKILALLQRVAPPSRGPRPAAFRRSFTYKKFMEELDLFYRTYIRGLRGRRWAGKNEQVLFRGFEWIVKQCLRDQKIFCHRDFHVRNIQVYRHKLYLLDFQDARLGPPAYDAASFLYDAYYRLGGRFRDAMLDLLLEKTGRAGAAAERFRRRVKIMALQRNLKAVGTFASQAVLRNNRTYLRYIPRTMAYVRENLACFPELRGFADTLQKS
jgi:aminoglycoside/choline kinase family phosphotransferase